MFAILKERDLTMKCQVYVHTTYIMYHFRGFDVILETDRNVMRQLKGQNGFVTRRYYEMLTIRELKITSSKTDCLDGDMYCLGVLVSCLGKRIVHFIERMMCFFHFI